MQHNFRLLLSFLLSLLLLTGTAVTAELVFSETFDQPPSRHWRLPQPKAWELRDRSLSATAFSASAELTVELPEGVIVEGKVMPIEPEPDRPGGFCGIKFSGINFVIREEGFWYPFVKRGAKRATGRLKRQTVTLNRWYHFTIERHPNGLFRWLVDGEKVCEILEPEMKGSLFLVSWRFKSAFDDIKIYRLSGNTNDSPPNLLRNSSFELLQDNLPPYWSPSTFTEPYLFYGSMANFWRMWRIDTRQAYHAFNSLRTQKGGAYSFRASTAKARPYTFSVYLKGSKDNISAELIIWEWNSGRGKA